MNDGVVGHDDIGTYVSIHDDVQDSTPFTFHEERRVIDYFGEQLRAAGFSYYGSEPLYR